MTPREELIEDALVEIKRTVGALFRARVTNWLNVEITVPQLKALFAVASCTDVTTVGALAERLDVGLSAASHLVERLVQNGFVQRSDDPQNRRRTLIELTPHGRELMSRLLEGDRSRMRAWLRCLETPRLEGLCDGLRALSTVAEASLDAQGGVAWHAHERGHEHDHERGHAGGGSPFNAEQDREPAIDA